MSRGFLGNDFNRTSRRCPLVPNYPPEMDGFQVLEAIAGPRMPVVIFVTAHDQYAIKAFEVHALDYLLKSFDRERFSAALQRAKIQIRQSKENLSERLVGLLEDLEKTPKACHTTGDSIGGSHLFGLKRSIGLKQPTTTYASMRDAMLT